MDRATPAMPQSPLTAHSPGDLRQSYTRQSYTGIKGSPVKRVFRRRKKLNSNINMATDLISDHTFHFTALPVEQQLLSDLQPLNQFPPEALQAMTEMALSFLAQQSADPDGTFIFASALQLHVMSCYSRLYCPYMQRRCATLHPNTAWASRRQKQRPRL